MIVILGFLFAVVNGQSWCFCGPTSVEDTNLGAITLVGDATSIRDTTNCPKPIGPRDLTNIVADLRVTGLYELQYTVTTCGLYYQSTVGAWIDYNHNGVFETTENLFTRQLFGGGLYTNEFQIPASTTYFGNTRLRVQLQETDLPSLNPCANFTYGATKDFTVNIKAHSAYCTAGPTLPEDTHLGPLIFGGYRNSLIQYTQPCPGFIGPVNYTDIFADVIQGDTYPVAFSVITCNKQYPLTLASAWIDFDQNQQWEESERVVPSINKFGAIITNVPVPLDAKVGVTAARFMVQEAAVGQTTINPCDNFKWGATQDYLIQILPRGSTLAGMNYREAGTN